MTTPNKQPYESKKSMKPRKDIDEVGEAKDIKPSPPPQNTGLITAKLEAARNKVTEAFNSFHSLLCNKKLNANKLPHEKQDENKVAQNLFNAAAELDMLNAGEGTMIVGSISLRELLKMRDRMNEIEYRLLLTKKELNELKEALGEKKE